jgi:DNA (cytosine-5)-methyltransferase 1
MSKISKQIPIIDLFAGPGGLGEGFSSLLKENKRVFDIKISIEKDANAHKTLELRSFYRQFSKGEVPVEYYNVLKESDLGKRETLISELYTQYNKEYKVAKSEAWQAELGSEKFPSSLIDGKIGKALSGAKEWVLIGGPPCQAYSMAGRSRVGGIDKEDHRVYLYKEYLRIIAHHHPSVFVMENVKGLLSAKVEGEYMFDLMLSDLKKPATVFKKSKSPEYKVYSLSTTPESYDEQGNPLYKLNSDFLIKSENFSVPQKRHRVILLGVRTDLNISPEVLIKGEKEIELKQIIGDLPQLRSGIGRSILSCEIVKGKKKRTYQKESNTDSNWQNVVNNFQNRIIEQFDIFSSKDGKAPITAPEFGEGAEYVKCLTPDKLNPLASWYADEKMEGIPNHQARTHLVSDLNRYLFSSMYAKHFKSFPRMQEYEKFAPELLPDHSSAKSGKFADRFRVQMPNKAATTVTSHISKDGHYFIHYDPKQCRSLTVREAARIQTFPDNYLFCGPRTAQYHQVGNAVPPYLAFQIAEIVNDIFKENKNNG